MTHKKNHFILQSQKLQIYNKYLKTNNATKNLQEMLQNVADSAETFILKLKFKKMLESVQNQH